MTDQYSSLALSTISAMLAEQRADWRARARHLQDVGRALDALTKAKKPRPVKLPRFNLRGIRV